MSFSTYRDVLPNGLRIVTIETPHLHTALLSVYLRTGSRHETPANNGVSHFLEHLFFRGSEGYPDTVRMNALVEEVGGNLNGVTCRDYGYYETPLHPSHLAVGVRILGDMLTRPLLTHLDVEKKIILEEMLDEVDENGRDIDVDNLSKVALFGDHPLSMKIAGTPQTVSAMTLEQIRAHYEQNYVTGNMVVTVAGRVKREEVVALVSDAFARLPKGPANTEIPAVLRDGSPALFYTSHEESQTAFRLSFPGVPEQHPDFPALLLLRRVLDDGLSSRLPYRIVEQKGLAYTVQAQMDAYDDVGLFEIDGACAPDKAGEVLEEVLDVIGEIGSRGATEEEIARAKRRQKIFLEFAHDSPGELAAWFGMTEIFRAPETFADRIAATEKVDMDVLRRVTKQYLDPNRLTVVAVGPKKGRRPLERVVGALSSR